MPLEQRYFIPWLSLGRDIRSHWEARNWFCRQGLHMPARLPHRMTAGLTNGALVSFDYRRAHKAVGVALSAAKQGISHSSLPSSLRRRLGETSGRHPRRFYTPCNREERRLFNGFLFNGRQAGRQHTCAPEIHRSHHLLQGLLPRRQSARKREREKSTQTTHRERDKRLSIFLFSLSLEKIPGNSE